MQGLEILLIENESFLMNRILAFAKKLKYTQYTSTLEEAWRLSISGLTESLIETLRNCSQKPDLGPHMRDNPLTQFAKEEAKLHRKRGVTIGMFLGLMKYYRQTYMDLCDEKGDPAKNEKYKEYLLWCFDTIEVGFCSEWGNTDNVQMIEELQKGNRFLTNEKNAYLTVFESLVDPVFMVNFDQEVINHNHAASLLVEHEITKPGYAYYSAIIDEPIAIPTNTTIYELLPWIPNEMLETDPNARFKTSSLSVTIDNELKHYEIVVSNMLDVSEKFTASIISLRDLTEHKNTELKLIESLNSRNQFLSIIAHDVVSPLSGIIGLLSLLKDEQNEYTEEEQQSLITNIYESSTLLDRLIRNLLGWSQIQTDRIKFRPIRYLLKETVVDLLRLYTEVAHLKGIELIDEIGSSIEVFADKEMMTTVLRNLISNAIKFTNAGGQVRIGSQFSDENGALSISVKDTGVGIPQGQLDDLFREDRKLQSLGTSNEEGTGLGLLLCSEFVKRNGGQIVVHSREGEGSEFCITLPVS